MQAHLKIKIKSLAAEAAIIHREEIRHRDMARRLAGRQGYEKHQATHQATRRTLHDHRVVQVRRAARYAQLAYGLLRGRDYRSVENTCKEFPSVELLTKEVARFGGVDKEMAADMATSWLENR